MYFWFLLIQLVKLQEALEEFLLLSRYQSGSQVSLNLLRNSRSQAVVNEGACKLKLETFFFLGIYTLPLPKSRKVGSLVGKLLGRKRSS